MIENRDKLNAKSYATCIFIYNGTYRRYRYRRAKWMDWICNYRNIHNHKTLVSSAMGTVYGSFLVFGFVRKCNTLNTHIAHSIWSICVHYYHSIRIHISYYIIILHNEYICVKSGHGQYCGYSHIVHSRLHFFFGHWRFI